MVDWAGKKRFELDVAIAALVLAWVLGAGHSRFHYAKRHAHIPRAAGGSQFGVTCAEDGLLDHVVFWQGCAQVA